MTSKAADAKLLEVLKPSEAGFEKAWRALCERQATRATEAQQAEASELIAKVRTGGDRALRSWSRSTTGLNLDPLEVTADEWDAACESVDPAVRAALGKAAMRIREFHRKRVPSSWEMREEGGGYMGQRLRPFSRVAFVASTAGTLTPTNLIMSVTPPSAVEVPHILVAAPVQKDGTVSPELLMAARIAGVHRVYKLCGPAAVAAFAYGTPLIERVDKIVLEADAELDYARSQLAGRVGFCGGGSGPREMCLVADKTAQPAWVAADLLAHAETGRRAQTVVITHVRSLATKIQEQLAKQIKKLDSSRVAQQSLASSGTVILTPNVETSIALAEEYAPEKLVLAVQKPEPLAKTLSHAGEIFMGHYTPPALGEFLAGPSASRDSGGRARFESAFGVEDFLKRTNFIQFEAPKLRELGLEAVRLAESADLSGHGTSVELRLQKIRRVRREREQAREAEF